MPLLKVVILQSNFKAIAKDMMMEYICTFAVVKILDSTVYEIQGTVKVCRPLVYFAFKQYCMYAFVRILY